MYNTNTQTLGAPCERGHVYESTGMTLRNICNNQCVECRKIYSAKYRAAGRHQDCMKLRGYKDVAEYTRMRQHRLCKQSPMAENRTCASFLGVVVAESVLVNVFNDVVKMPYGNPGYDFICNRGKKIDVKSACLTKSGQGWGFNITHNTIADYFLLLAFDNRDDLTPMHIWLISATAIVRGKRVCEYDSIMHISKSNRCVSQFAQYAQVDTLRDVVNCCDKMKTGTRV